MNFRNPEMLRLMKMILWKKSRESLQAQGEELAFQLRYVSKNEKKILQGVTKMAFFDIWGRPDIMPGVPSLLIFQKSADLEI
jgi:hypothetical protein